MNKKQISAVVFAILLALTAGAHILFTTEVLNTPDAIKNIVNEFPLWASSILAFSAFVIALYTFSRADKNLKNTYSREGYNSRFTKKSAKLSENEISSRLDYLEELACLDIITRKFAKDEFSRLLNKKDIKGIIEEYLKLKEHYLGTGP